MRKKSLKTLLDSVSKYGVDVLTDLVKAKLQGIDCAHCLGSISVYVSRSSL